MIYYVIKNKTLNSEIWWSSTDINYVFQERSMLSEMYPTYEYIVEETSKMVDKNTNDGAI